MPHQAAPNDDLMLIGDKRRQETTALSFCTSLRGGAKDPPGGEGGGERLGGVGGGGIPTLCEINTVLEPQMILNTSRTCSTLTIMAAPHTTRY